MAINTKRQNMVTSLIPLSNGQKTMLKSSTPIKKSSIFKPSANTNTTTKYNN